MPKKPKTPHKRPPAKAAPKPPPGASQAPAAPGVSQGDVGASIGEWVAIDSISEWAKNPRKISKRAVEKVAKSIREFGFASPIICRKADRKIVAGHTRYRAAKSLGLERVPVRFLDLTEKQARKLAIADNRTGEEADWDFTLLAEQIREMQDEDEDLESLAFDDHEIADILKAAEEPLDMGAERMQAVKESDSFHFRSVTIPISVDVGNRLEQALERYCEERGSYNGFVEYVLEEIGS